MAESFAHPWSSSGPSRPRGQLDPASASALQARAVAAIDRANVLRIARSDLHTLARATQARSTALRALGVARRAERWAAPAPPSRDSGRIVRSHTRRRRAAASEVPDTSWAQALVYGTRRISGADAGLAKDGPFGESVAAGEWTVREVDTRATPGARAPRCLIFENHALVRRVWSFPPGWLALPSMALFRLAGLLP